MIGCSIGLRPILFMENNCFLLGEVTYEVLVLACSVSTAYCDDDG